MAAKGLSKENLKNELIAHNIPLPSPGSKKEKYVELYEKYLSSSNNVQSEFSSDEEASPRLKVKRIILTTKEEMERSTRNVTVNGLKIGELSDDDLREQLIKCNFQPGPIIEQTRAVYEQHLARLLTGDAGGDDISKSSVMDGDYSDSEGEEDIQILKNSLHAQLEAERDGTPTTRSEAKKAEQRRTPVKRTPESNKAHLETPGSEAFDYTPIARRSIRSNITYKAIDPEILKSFSKDRRNRQDDVGKLASDVVEQVQEPAPPRKSRFITLFLIILAIIAVFLGILVYQNMEASGGDLAQLPDVSTADQSPKGK